MAKYGTNSVTVVNVRSNGCIDAVHHFGTGYQELVFSGWAHAERFAKAEGVPLSGDTRERITQQR